MSHQNVIRFMERVLSDEEFKADLQRLETTDEGDSVQQLIDCAAEAGLPFTEEELDEIFLAAVAQEAEGELSADELEAVTGGTTQQLQEMGVSFNLQYLNLQQQISQESRQYSLVSNIMKVKHDTAMSSINNIR